MWELRRPLLQSGFGPAASSSPGSLSEMQTLSLAAALLRWNQLPEAECGEPWLRAVNISEAEACSDLSTAHQRVGKARKLSVRVSAHSDLCPHTPFCPSYPCWVFFF